MTDRKAMQMALDALMTCREDWIFDGEDERPVDTYDEEMVSKAFKALRVRLAQPEQEPVAWRAWFDADNGARWLFSLWPEEERLDVEWQPLYTAPPQREWQGLSDEELIDAADAAPYHTMVTAGDYIYILARAIEAKLKEKNK